MRRGGLPPSVSISAPISANGCTIRSIGRVVSDWSPVNSLVNRRVLRRPASSRMAVPELPQSTGEPGADNPSIPRPMILRTLELSCSLRTPSVRSACRQERQSADAGMPCNSLVPSDMAASISARCAIDLSPGAWMCPDMPPGATVMARRPGCLCEVAVTESCRIFQRTFFRAVMSRSFCSGRPIVIRK